MRLLRTFFLLVLVFSAGTVLSQGKLVQKTYAYYDSSAASGNKTYFIYIETKQDTIPVWDTAIINGVLYAVHADKVESNPVQIGVRKTDNKLITIRPGIDNFIWKLVFDLAEAKKPVSKHMINSNEIILMGKYKGKKLSYKVRNLVELVPIE